MMLPVRKRERVAHEFEDMRPRRPIRFKLVDGAQIVDERDGVDGHAALVHAGHRREDRLVRGTVEVIGEQLDEGLLDNLAREHHGG